MPNSKADMNMPSAQESGSDAAEDTSSAPPSGTAAKGTSAIDLLKADHRAVEQMFARFENAEDAQKAELALRICKALTIHVMLEEEIFYPACRGNADDEDPLDEAQVEHDSAKILIADIWRSGGQDPLRNAKIKVLSEQVRHHVQEEEKARSGIMARALKDGVDMNALGGRIASRKAELESRDDLAPVRPMTFEGVRGNGGTTKESKMPNMQHDRGSRSRDDDRGSRFGARARDEDGRFISSRRSRDDDDDDRGRSSRGRDRDDDDDRRGGRGRGGWFGDGRGHSEAAQRRWDDRGSSHVSGRRDDDDNRRGSSMRSRGDGDDGRGRDRRGWFGDSRGHSEAASRGRDDDRSGRSMHGRGMDDDDRRSSSRSRGRDDDDRGRGWHGDSRGHSEAARRGWDDRASSSGSRSSRDYDDRGDRSSRGRDEDDRGRGRGGWFGDSRGHSEAARRGWESRH